MKKKNKFLTKIPYICVIVSMLLGLVGVVASADSNSIGEGTSTLGNLTLYDSAAMDHGLPFDLSFNGQANSQVNNYVGFKSINYTLDKFGVTYPSSNENSSEYLSDQNPKVYSLAKPSSNNPYSSTFNGALYSYYDFLGVVVSRWYNQSIDYSYGAYLLSPNLTYWLYANSSEIYEGVNEAIDRATGDLITGNTNVASSVNYKFNGTLFSNLLSDTSYAPYTMTNYCLMPLDANQTGIRLYYDVVIDGYAINSDGVRYSKHNEYKSTDSYDEIGAYFEYNVIQPTYDHVTLTYDAMTDYFDGGYGLVTYACDFYFTEFCAAMLDDDYVVTDIDITFGLEAPNTYNSQIINFKNTYGSYPIYGSSIGYEQVSPYTYNEHLEKVAEYSRNGYGQISTVDDININWLGTTLGGVLDVNLFGTFGLSDILYVVLGIGLVVMFIKLFAGG